MLGHPLKVFPVPAGISPCSSSPAGDFPARSPPGVWLSASRPAPALSLTGASPCLRSAENHCKGLFLHTQKE